MSVIPPFAGVTATKESVISAPKEHLWRKCHEVIPFGTGISLQIQPNWFIYSQHMSHIDH